ncbi:MAG: PilZ domain-containing protein [Gammaproteobacteria bacterium]|jgi:hypothetical protein
MNKAIRGSNQRRHLRTPLRCQFKIWHDSVGEMLVTTRDISDGGLFLIMDEVVIPPIGTVLRGQVQGLMADAPVVVMEVVRVEPGGIGLRFIPDPN